MNGSEKLYFEGSFIGVDHDEHECKTDRVMKDEEELNGGFQNERNRSIRKSCDYGSSMGARKDQMDVRFSTINTCLKHNHQEAESSKLKFVKRIQKPSSIIFGNPTEVKSLFQQNSNKSSLSQKQRSSVESRSVPLLTISFQQSISINLKQRIVYFSQLRFSSSHLSELVDQEAAPLIVLPDSVPSKSQLSTAIQKIWPALNTFKADINPRLFNQQLELRKQILEHPNSLNCKCGRKAEKTLACSHVICGLCLNSQENCSVCSLVINKANIDSINCLFCERIKTKTFTCLHYCLDCIKTKMLSTENFLCRVCNYRFEKLVINAIYKKCGNCKVVKADLFEICRDCYCCADCLYLSFISNQCKCCNTAISSTDVQRLKTNALIPCRSCMKSLCLDKLCVKKCCNSIMCHNCAAFPCKVCRKRN